TTVLSLGAFKITVQVPELLGDGTAGVHDTDDGLTGGSREMVCVRDADPYCAVMTEDNAVVIRPAVALKLALMEPGERVTVVGTGRRSAVLESATVMPPAGAALERTAEQLVFAFGSRLSGLHWNVVRVTGATRERLDV